MQQSATVFTGINFFGFLGGTSESDARVRAHIVFGRRSVFEGVV